MLDRPAHMWVQVHPSGYHGTVSRVIQIRDVPDDVHDALVEAAEAQGLSLTRYMLPRTGAPGLARPRRCTPTPP